MRLFRLRLCATGSSARGRVRKAWRWCWALARGDGGCQQQGEQGRLVHGDGLSRSAGSVVVNLQFPRENTAVPAKSAAAEKELRGETEQNEPFAPENAGITAITPDSRLKLQVPHYSLIGLFLGLGSSNMQPIRPLFQGNEQTSLRGTFMRILNALSLALIMVAVPELLGEEKSLDRDALVARLRQREGLLRSLYLEFDVHVLDVPQDKARQLDATFRFWRKDAKQRVESELADPELAKGGTISAAFDGQIRRNLRKTSDGKLFASIATANTADWYKMNKEDPFSFLFTHYERPLSHIVEEAAAYSSAIVTVPSGHAHQIAIKHRDDTRYHHLHFRLDERYRLLERRISLANRNGDIVPTQKIVFSNYVSYPTSSGEAVWFPERLVSFDFSESSSLDNPTISNQREYVIRKVELNGVMDDNLFVLEIPKEAEVNDLVTGRGWLPPAERPAVLFPEEYRVRRFLFVYVLPLVLMLIVAASYYYIRGRRRANIVRP